MDYAVIFDMDGLLFETERVFVQAWDFAGEQAGLGKAGYMVEKTLGMPIAAAEQIWQVEFAGHFDMETFKRYSKEFLQDYYEKQAVPVKLGVYELLDFLRVRQVPLAVATSSPQWEAEKHLKRAGIYERFTAIICGDMVKQSKPNPDIYLAACDSLGKEPTQCYALEDSKNGLHAAYAAGCMPLMVPDLWLPDATTTAILAGQFETLLEVREYFATNFIM